MHDEVREVGCPHTRFGKKTVDALSNLITQLELALRSSDRCRILTRQEDKDRVA